MRDFPDWYLEPPCEDEWETDDEPDYDLAYESYRDDNL